MNEDNDLKKVSFLASLSTVVYGEVVHVKRGDTESLRSAAVDFPRGATYFDLANGDATVGLSARSTCT